MGVLLSCFPFCPTPKQGEKVIHQRWQDSVSGLVLLPLVLFYLDFSTALPLGYKKEKFLLADSPKAIFLEKKANKQTTTTTKMPDNEKIKNSFKIPDFHMPRRIWFLSVQPYSEIHTCSHTHKCAQTYPADVAKHKHTHSSMYTNSCIISGKNFKNLPWAYEIFI